MVKHKLTPEDKDDIRYLFSREPNISKLARQYGVSRAYIRFIVYPEKLEKNREQRRERNKQRKEQASE